MVAAFFLAILWIRVRFRLRFETKARTKVRVTVELTFGVRARVKVRARLRELLKCVWVRIRVRRILNVFCGSYPVCRFGVTEHRSRLTRLSGLGLKLGQS